MSCTKRRRVWVNLLLTVSISANATHVQSATSQYWSAEMWEWAEAEVDYARVCGGYRGWQGCGGDGGTHQFLLVRRTLTVRPDDDDTARRRAPRTSCRPRGQHATAVRQRLPEMRRIRKFSSITWYRIDSSSTHKWTPFESKAGHSHTTEIKTEAKQFCFSFSSA